MSINTIKKRVAKITKLAFLSMVLFLINFNHAHALVGAITEAFKGAITWAVDRVIALLLGTIAWVLSWFVGITGVLLDQSLEISVVRMKEFVDSITVIDDAWILVRDFGNMVFIFIILWIAINLILQVQDGGTSKKLLVRLVIVALLVNFSLFFTKIMIDASNIITLGFYNEIIASGSTVAESILRALGIQNIYSIDVYSAIIDSAQNGTLAAIVYGLGSIFLLSIAFFILLTISLLFVIRFVVLIILMILAPAAFVGMILPLTQKMVANPWWDSLRNQLIWPPIWAALTLISVRILGEVTGAILGGEEFSPLETFQQAPVETSSGALASLVTPVIGFMAVAIFLIASIIISKKVASQSAGIGKEITSYGMKMSGFGYAGKGVATGAARQTIGRPARWMDEKLRQTKIGNTGVFSAIRGGTVGALSKQKFGGKSYAETHEEAKTDKNRRSAIDKALKARRLDERSRGITLKDKAIDTATLRNLRANRAEQANSERAGTVARALGKVPGIAGAQKRREGSGTKASVEKQEKARQERKKAEEERDKVFAKFSSHYTTEKERERRIEEELRLAREARTAAENKVLKNSAEEQTGNNTPSSTAKSSGKIVDQYGRPYNTE